MAGPPADQYGARALTASNDLWPLLTRIRDFTLQVFRPVAGELRLAADGSGSLRVEEVGNPDSDSLVWHESGRWETGALAGVAFHNATLWRRLPGGGIELHHLRRGADHPTRLVELRPADPAPRWQSFLPHDCGPDRYLARITWTTSHLVLHWDVESPSDPYALRWTGRIG